MQTFARRRLQSMLLGIAIATAFIGVAAADATHALVGISQWSGHYDYINNSQPAVPFTLTLRVVADGTFMGATTEPATFGNGSSAALTASVKGLISGTNLQFIKTYDGSGGQTHSIEYAGSVSADGTSMHGTWRIDDLHGQFDATLVSLSNPSK